MVAHLVGGIAQHQHHLFHAQGDAPQQQGEAVAAQNGERDTYGLAAGLGLHVGGDLLAGGVVALAAGHHGLGHSHHIAITGGDAVFLQRVQNGVHRGLDDVVALAENRRANAPDDRAQSSAHSNSSPIILISISGAAQPRSGNKYITFLA